MDASLEAKCERPEAMDGQLRQERDGRLAAEERALKVEAHIAELELAANS